MLLKIDFIAHLELVYFLMAKSFFNFYKKHMKFEWIQKWSVGRLKLLLRLFVDNSLFNFCSCYSSNYSLVNCTLMGIHIHIADMNNSINVISPYWSAIYFFLSLFGRPWRKSVNPPFPFPYGCSGRFGHGRCGPGQSASGNMASGADNLSVNLRSRSAPGAALRESFVRFWWSLVSFNAARPPTWHRKFKTGDLA